MMTQTTWLRNTRVSLTLIKNFSNIYQWQSFRRVSHRRLCRVSKSIQDSKKQSFIGDEQLRSEILQHNNEQDNRKICRQYFAKDFQRFNRENINLAQKLIPNSMREGIILGSPKLNF